MFDVRLRKPTLRGYLGASVHAALMMVKKQNIHEITAAHMLFLAGTEQSSKNTSSYQINWFIVLNTLLCDSYSRLPSKYVNHKRFYALQQNQPCFQ